MAEAVRPKPKDRKQKSKKPKPKARTVGETSKDVNSISERLAAGSEIHKDVDAQTFNDPEISSDIAESIAEEKKETEPNAQETKVETSDPSSAGTTDVTQGAKHISSPEMIAGTDQSTDVSDVHGISQTDIVLPDNSNLVKNDSTSIAEAEKNESPHEETLSQTVLEDSTPNVDNLIAVCDILIDVSQAENNVVQNVSDCAKKETEQSPTEEVSANDVKNIEVTDAYIGESVTNSELPQPGLQADYVQEMPTNSQPTAPMETPKTDQIPQSLPFPEVASQNEEQPELPLSQKQITTSSPEFHPAISHHTQQEPQSVFRFMEGGPAVVEDPDTPMTRAKSPGVVKSTGSEQVVTPPPRVPTIVQEEKSPSLLAQEALARNQTVDTATAPFILEKEQGISKDLVAPSLSDFLPNEKQGVSSAVAKESVKPKKISVQTVVDSNKSKSVSKTIVQTSIPEPLYGQVKEHVKCSIGALTLNDLLALYYNPQLASNSKFVEDFVQKENHKEGHEFLEILSTYFRARHQHVSAEGDVHSLQKAYKNLQNELWIMHSRTQIVQGTCADQVKVNTSFTYEQCELNRDALGQIKTNLQEIHNMITQNLSLHAYTSQISKLQVESYIYGLYLTCPLLRDVPKNASVQARGQVSEEERYQMGRFQDCISILFMFHRKPTSDKEFIDNIRQWTTRLVSSLLRVATFNDHLFILNHLLRCPAGVSKWATNLIQVPPVSYGSQNFQSSAPNSVLNHVVTGIATILFPIKGREEFMGPMRVNLTQESIQEGRAWIMVDSDGEEDEDAENSWLYLHENDVVGILGQFSLADVFAHVLNSAMSETGQVDYDIQRTTEPMMMKLFAFSTVLIQLFGSGLGTYSMARYRQLNKRLGRLIRQTVSFVSDHWLNFQTHYGIVASEASLARLQMEYDQLFMRATYSILVAQNYSSTQYKLGSWQFMADMPFTCVSTDSMWQLLWILHQGQGQMLNLDSLPPVEVCKTYIQDPDSWQQLADNLMRMSTSEAIYLLTTFANMASCRSYFEQDFIQAVTSEVFEIAYISSHTREFCSKVGRELLSGIIQTHPSALSFLLARVKEVMVKVGKMALYLFSELPVSIWQPSDPDMLILRQWLLNYDLSFVEHQLSQMVLSKINWGVFEQSGRLVVDIRLHRQMALLLVEAYTRFISEKRAGFFIVEGMKQACNTMASCITSALTPEQSFNNWVWDLALRLKLHQQSAMLHSSGTVDQSFDPPNLATASWLAPVVKGTVNKSPIACFVALMMTNIGHDISDFVMHGIDLLSALTSSSQYTTSIHVLGCVVPMFVDSQQYLLENVGFAQILQLLLVADESLFKSTKAALMVVDFPGIVIQQLSEMIHAQVTSHLSQGKADGIITFWVKMMLKVSKNLMDKNACYIIDSLLHWSLVKKGVNDFLTEIFKENHTKFCAAQKDRQGIVSSVFSWIASQQSLPSFMDGSPVSGFPWLAHMVLTVETEMEVTSGLWQVMQQELHKPQKASVEKTLQLAVNRLKLEQAPQASKLSIYRWAQQALDTPHDHPILPVLWQRFFALFLGRMMFDTGTIGHRASAGEHFFSSMSYASMMKKMRKRLGETSNFHLNYDDSDKTRESQNFAQSPVTPTSADDLFGASSSTPTTPTASPLPGVEYSSSKEFHQMLARLYQTYSLWLEEPRLHDANLYLPALPPAYEAARLNIVFQGYMGPWLEFMDLEGIQYMLGCKAADWKKRLTALSSGHAAPSERRNTMLEPENATERIMRRLRRYDSPKEVPAISTIQSPVPLIDKSIIENKSSLMHLMDADLEMINNHTKVFSTRQAQHCAVDNFYLELIPHMFANVPRTVSLTAECKSSLNPMHRCTGAAVLPVRVDVKEANEITHRKVEENRAEYKQIIIQSLLPIPPTICIAAVHMENAITMLIKLRQKTVDNVRAENLSDIACELFFKMANMICMEINFFPPSKQFFTSCIEILGQEFVSQDPNQMDSVLRLCLDKPLVSGLISQHFRPNSCPASLVTMYGQLIYVLQAQNMDLVFMLLTKFDVTEWLESYNPSDNERKNLVEYLGSALMACGSEPSAESRLSFGLYIAHLKHVLETKFPSNLYSVINMILQGSAADSLHPRVWETLIFSCFMNSALHSDSSESSIYKMTTEDCREVQLSTVQVKEVMDWMGSYFMHMRMGNQESSDFGLYVSWQRYVPCIGFFFSALLRSFITKVLNGSDNMTPYQIVEILWQPLVGVYAPWIQPMVGPDGSVNFPWVENDETLAIHLASSMVKAVTFIYQKMQDQHPTSASGIFSLLLMYYMTGLCNKTSPYHVVQVYMSEMKRLPWQELRPDVQLLETMAKMKEMASGCCFELIGHIICQINWRDVIGYTIAQQPPEMASRMQTSLAVILIQAYVDKEMLEKNDDIYKLLVNAERFDWSMITPEGFTYVCSWFIQLCDPKCALAQRSSRLAVGLRLLRQMAGFHSEITWNESLVVKRVSYIHCVTQQLCQVTYAKDVAVETVKTAIVNLLSEIEAVESCVSSSDGQQDESERLLKDILSLLNNGNPDGVWLDTIMSSVTGWLQASPQSILIVPCMKTASTSLASMLQMAVVMESCMQAYFLGFDANSLTPGTNPKATGWNFILATLQMPELNQAMFVAEASKGKSFLVLYAYLRFKLPFCKTILEEMSQMEEILSLCGQLQPSDAKSAVRFQPAANSETASASIEAMSLLHGIELTAEDEAKLTLLWHHFLCLAVRQVDKNPGSLSRTIGIINTFVAHLNTLGQERANKGLLGAIGLGRKSPLSIKMRFFALAIASYLQAQTFNSESLRLQPVRPPATNSLSGDLKNMRKNKQFSQVLQAYQQLIEFTANPSNTFRNVLQLVTQLSASLYPNHSFLTSAFRL